MAKRSRSKPELVQDADFTSWRGSQLWVMADWMGVLRQAQALKKADERKNLVREACLANLPRAQKGYELIVLMREPATPDASKLPAEMESRMYGLLTKIVDDHKGSMGETAALAVRNASESVRDSLVEYAKKAIDIATERRAPIVIKEGTKKRKITGVLPPEFKQMVELAAARIPIMLVGPAGCGKTYLAGKLAEALNLEYSDQSCSEGMSESVFNGLLLPIGKGGMFQHVSSPFMERYETGGVHLLDEIDAGDPNLFTYINKAIANDSYTVPQRYKNPVVSKHADFVLIAAANTYGNGADAMYVGRNQLDAATLDRFKVGLVTLDYSQDVELSLAMPELCQWAWGIRSKIRANKIRRIMSTRVIEHLSRMTELYSWKEEDWTKAYFTGWTDAERRLVI